MPFRPMCRTRTMWLDQGSVGLTVVLPLLCVCANVQMYLAIVVLGALHGLVFLPVLLSLVGPPSTHRRKGWAHLFAAADTHADDDEPWRNHGKSADAAYGASPAFTDISMQPDRPASQDLPSPSSPSDVHAQQHAYQHAYPHL